MFLQHSRPHFLARLRVGARHACRRFRVASSSTSILGNFRDELDTLGVRRRLGGIPRGSHRAHERSGLGRLSAGRQSVESSYGGRRIYSAIPPNNSTARTRSGRRREASQPHSAVAEKSAGGSARPSGPRKSFFRAQAAHPAAARCRNSWPKNAPDALEAIHTLDQARTGRLAGFGDRRAAPRRRARRRGDESAENRMNRPKNRTTRPPRARRQRERLLHRHEARRNRPRSNRRGRRRPRREIPPLFAGCKVLRALRSTPRRQALGAIAAAAPKASLNTMHGTNRFSSSLGTAATRGSNNSNSSPICAGSICRARTSPTTGCDTSAASRSCRR